MSAVLREAFKPVQHARLLSDAKGPYGIAVDRHDGEPAILVIRNLNRNRSLPTLFHGVPKVRASWAKGSEKDMVHALHHAMLRDRGIPFGEKQNPSADDWKLYHGLRCLATRVINSLLAELYAEIPADLLRVVRRYPIKWRGNLYQGLFAEGKRAWQLADSFPWLAAVLYESDDNTARELVRRGAKLRDIAKASNVPMSFRRFRPAVVGHLSRLHEFLSKYPDIVSHHCPPTVPRQRAWLRAISEAHPYEHYAVWVAKHWQELGHWRGAPNVVTDMRDWIKACYDEGLINGIQASDIERLCKTIRTTGDQGTAAMLGHWWDERKGSALTSRKFTSAMHGATALRLSEAWHDRQARTQAADVKFPEPWYDAGTVADWHIVPITSAVELSRYAYQLHNCATSYAHQIAQHGCFLYAVLEGDKPVAMLELLRGETPKMRQLKGPCNRDVPKPLKAAARRWFNRCKREHGAGRMKPERVFPEYNFNRAGGNDVDDPLPF